MCGIVGHAHDTAAIDGILRTAQEGRTDIVGQRVAFGTGQQGRHGRQLCDTERCWAWGSLVGGAAGRDRCRRWSRRVGRMGCVGRIAGNARGGWSGAVGVRGDRADMRFAVGGFLPAAGDKTQAQQAGNGQMCSAVGAHPPVRAKGCTRGFVRGSVQRGMDVGGGGRGGPVGVLHRTVSAGKAGPMVAHLGASACAESRRREVFLTPNAYAKGTGWIRNNSSLESLYFGSYRSSIHVPEWMP